MGAERKGRLAIKALKKIWGRGAKDVFTAIEGYQSTFNMYDLFYAVLLIQGSRRHLL